MTTRLVGVGVTQGVSVRRRTFFALLCAMLVAVGGLPALAGDAGVARPVPPVVAVVGETAGVNVLHEDFRTADGRDPVYPRGMPTPELVTLPATGSFAARMAAVEAGPLGRPKPGRLYAVRGTRLLFYAAPGVTTFVGGDRGHATGTLSSAVGRRFGTAPDALGLVVPGATPAAFEWLSRQSWVDVASMSTYGVRTVNSSEPATTPICLGAEPVSRWINAGHAFFSSSGNTTDQPEALVSPNGLSGVYQVGGVDATGKSWLPGHPEETDPYYAVGNVVRPYETGELFSFPAAAPDSLTGSVHFGGTSGATPRTAGRAAVLVGEARLLLGSRGRGLNLADASPGARLPRTGPLADGSFSAQELVRLLHAVAVPALGAPGARYAVEGYGALTPAAQRAAVQVLRGAAQMPARVEDDTANTAAEQLRAALVDARCGIA